METLLSNYSLDQIAMFLVLFCPAVFGAYKFVLEVVQSLRAHFSKSLTAEQKQEEVYLCSKEMKERMGKLEDICDTLLQSDRRRIRAEIVRQYQWFLRQGQIDLYSLDVIQRQFNSYQKEGGNTYVEHLIQELEELPLVEGQSVEKCVGPKPVNTTA
jgi:hypothetical protein